MPWPYWSFASVAHGFVTAEAITREPCQPGVWKSGMSPAMPVSITATPTPRPVARDHALFAWTAFTVGWDSSLYVFRIVGSTSFAGPGNHLLLVVVASASRAGVAAARVGGAEAHPAVQRDRLDTATVPQAAWRPCA